MLEQQNPQDDKFFFFFLINSRSALLARMKWSVYISKSQRIVCVSFSRMDSGFCRYHLVVWSNFNFLHDSQWIAFPTLSCLVLYSLCACLLHSFIMWLIVSSLSPHILHWRFCYVLSIVALIWLVLRTLFCAVIRTYYYYYYLTFVFRWSLSDSKSSRVSKTRLSILAYLRMVSNLPHFQFHQSLCHSLGDCS